MMTTRLTTLSIDAEKAPNSAARAVHAGRVIAFPTDTVYGLGVALWQPAAIARLYALKVRPGEKALPVLMSDWTDYPTVALEPSPAADRLMRAFWPGPLTIVVPRKPDVPDEVGPYTTTIGLRVPGHAALRRVLARTGPLATSSANRSGEPPATDSRQVRGMFGTKLSMLLDGGKLESSPPSTVVDLSRRTPTILRRGAIDIAAIESVLSCLVVDDSITT